MSALRAVVAVPARDEQALIGRCMRALAAQRGLARDAYEVILVLDGCTAFTNAGFSRKSALRHASAAPFVVTPHTNSRHCRRRLHRNPRTGSHPSL